MHKMLVFGTKTSVQVEKLKIEENITICIIEPVENTRKKRHCETQSVEAILYIVKRLLRTKVLAMTFFRKLRKN